MKNTPLLPRHLRRGATMSPEEGWHMPQQFSNLMDEHLAARKACGLFDVSHLAKFSITGPGALPWLDGLFSNSVVHCRDGMGQRTLLLQENGGIIDKMLLFRESAGRFLLLGHAGMAEYVYRWLVDHRPDGPIEVRNETMRYSGIGLYGPEAARLLTAQLRGAELPELRGFRRLVFHDEEVLLVHMSLIADDCFELFCPAAEGISWYEPFIAGGAVPCGMHTHHCLRVEHAAVATGRDVGPDKTPVQASMARFCDLSKSFIGAEALRRQTRSGTENRMAAVECEQGSDNAPRMGDKLIDDMGATVGCVTSGCLSPERRHGMALAYLARRMARPGMRLRLLIDNTAIPVIVTEGELW